MTITEKLKCGRVILDGAMGTQLQMRGLPLGVLPEEWNLTHPEEVTAIHRAYFAAGSDVVCANTFGANVLKYGDRLEEVVRAAVKCADRARAGLKDKYIALDVGSCGKLLKPLGDLNFEDAVDIFKRTVKAGAEAGADLVFIETMNDVYELKAAVIAAKEVCSLPVFASAVFGSDGKMMTGTSPEAFVAIAEGLGVSALGINCSLAPAEMAPTVSRILKVSSTPVIVKPNAGLPREVGGKTVYSLGADAFAEQMKPLVEAGARLIGGCCGTDPDYIKKLVEVSKDIAVKLVEEKNLTAVASYTQARYFGDSPVLIGERINPTGKKRLKEALRAGDIGYVLNEAVGQTERGAHILDVNVGLPEIDEPSMLERCVTEIQAVSDLPLQIDTSDPVALERAMRIYNGKPLVNSVNGKRESMDAVFPLVKKYGGAVICLTLDEGGIPPTAVGRIKIAEKIIKEAARYGIVRGQLIFDTLAMAVSADGGAANAALDALDYIRHELGCNTSLGVSNISFGLPARDLINSTFLVMAFARGLSAAIYNPYSDRMTGAYLAYAALRGTDKNCLNYIGYAAALAPETNATRATVSADKAQADGDLKYCIIRGLKDAAERKAEELLGSLQPSEIINGHIIPALDEVGKGFENKTVFLPQLLLSAEAASAAFAQVKKRLGPARSPKKLKIVLATVKGDIHDIGKNIVATLLENYGFTVCDLGKDVPPERVLESALNEGAKLVGLSALMTTTVPSMRETIELLRREAPQIKICVGGAVLTEEYASSLGADRYCRDAMATVRYAEELEKIS